MNTVEMKDALIESTISVIGKEGIEKATTKKISKNAKLNEVYIYRLFGSKDKLFIDAFTKIDNILFDFLSDNFNILNEPEEREIKWKKYFNKIWDFVLSDHDRAMTYIYYYYSKDYTKYPREKRKNNFEKVKKLFISILKDNVDFNVMFDYVLDVIFTSVIKVIRDEINEEDAKVKVFNLIYMVVKPSLKDE